MSWKARTPAQPSERNCETEGEGAADPLLPLSRDDYEEIKDEVIR